MVSASKLLSKHHARLATGAAWFSSRLSIAALLGLLLALLLPYWLAPFLAAQRTPPATSSASLPATPVEIVRAVPVPVMDAQPPPSPAVQLPPTWEKERPASILQIVARRSRRQPQHESESGALGKAGTIGKAGAGTEKAPTAAPADSKAAAPNAEPPEPDAWSDTEIIAALRDCLRRLAPLGAEIEIAEPVRQERCGAPAPVVLKRVGSGATRVEFQPPPVLNCAMVASLNTWVDKVLQPAAQELLGSPVVRIRNVSGYVCRNRIGTTFHADRLSEHALANAIDISAFVTADGRTIEVLNQWGPTVRDLRAQEERAAEAADKAKAVAKEAEDAAAAAARAVVKAPRGRKREEAKAEAARMKEDAQRKREEAEKLEAERRNLARAADLQKLGRGSDLGAPAPRLRRGEREKSADARGLTPIPATKDAGTPPANPEPVFLRRLHRGACGTFGTVLGPDANEAHRNHFHFDLAQRKRSAFCE
jgi:hypothetical protein